MVKKYYFGILYGALLILFILITVDLLVYQIVHLSCVLDGYACLCLVGWDQSMFELWIPLSRSTYHPSRLRIVSFHTWIDNSLTAFQPKASSGRLGSCPCQSCSRGYASHSSTSFLWRWQLQSPGSRCSPWLLHNLWDEGYGPSQEVQTSSHTCN